MKIWPRCPWPRTRKVLQWCQNEVQQAQLPRWRGPVAIRASSSSFVDETILCNKNLLCDVMDSCKTWLLLLNLVGCYLIFDKCWCLSSLRLVVWFSYE